ncbi:MAG: hypothetical protein HYS87_02540 [Candidatus Colwellbacteria bacterium]|nr:hypothetical protein [Candidatus Colwellbacteria bacterium]
MQKLNIPKIPRYAIKPLIALIVSGIVIGISGWQINKISADIQSQKTNQEIQISRAENEQEHRDALAKIGEENYAKLEDSVPSSENILDFLVVLDSITRKYGIIQTPRFSQPIPLDDPGESGVRLAYTEYALNETMNITSLTSLLKEIEELQFFSPILSFSISSGEAFGGWASALSQTTVRARLYVKDIR